MSTPDTHAVLFTAIRRMSDEPDALCAFARVGGKQVIQRQLELAHDAGCRTAFCHVERIDPDVIALQVRAERDGLTFVPFERVGDLPGLVSEIEKLTVIQDGLSNDCLPSDLAQIRIWTFPDTAVSAGYERIDHQTSWAGVMTIDAGLVDALAELPPDIDIASSLLRIGLQSNVDSASLNETALTERVYEQIHSRADALAASRRRFDVDLRNCSWATPTRSLALRIAGRIVTRNFDPLSTARMTGAITVALFIGAVFALGQNAVVAALALLAMQTVTVELTWQIGRRIAAPSRAQFWYRIGVLPMRGIFDLALISAIAIESRGAWVNDVFAALTLFGMLYLAAYDEYDGVIGKLSSDRGVLAIVLLAATVMAVLLPVVQVLACAMLSVLLFCRWRRHTGKTVTIP
ncbi:MAG: hypothetical protein WA948_02555 [Pontixanthobacter sp.]